MFWTKAITILLWPDANGDRTDIPTTINSNNEAKISLFYFLKLKLEVLRNLYCSTHIHKTYQNFYWIIKTRTLSSIHMICNLFHKKTWLRLIVSHEQFSRLTANLSCKFFCDNDCRSCILKIFSLLFFLYSCSQEG